MLENNSLIQHGMDFWSHPNLCPPHRDGKPCYGELHVCFDQDEGRAREIAHEVWPLMGLSGKLFPEIPLPSRFEKAASLVTREKIASLIPCGPDPSEHLKAIQEYVDAGFDHVSIHQIEPNQEVFMDFYAREIFPRLSRPSQAA